MTKCNWSDDVEINLRVLKENNGFVSNNCKVLIWQDAIGVMMWKQTCVY